MGPAAVTCLLRVVYEGLRCAPTDNEPWTAYEHVPAGHLIVPTAYTGVKDDGPKKEKRGQP